MEIRRAKIIDIDQILVLLSEVLEIHAEIRPDFFISNSTKYSRDDLLKMVNDDDNPIYVVIDDNSLIAYAICNIKKPSARMRKPMKILFIDDFCVEEKYRNKHVGQTLFNYLIEEAKRLDCYEISLSQWEGNDAAKKFYEKMGMTVKETIYEYIIK